MARMDLSDLREDYTESWSKALYRETDGFVDTLEGIFTLETAVCDMVTLEELIVRYSTLSARTGQ